MRIYGGKDYYDIGLAYGHDDTYTFHRNTIDPIKVEDYKISSSRYGYSNENDKIDQLYNLLKEHNISESKLLSTIEDRASFFGLTNSISVRSIDITDVNGVNYYDNRNYTRNNKHANFTLSPFKIFICGTIYNGVRIVLNESANKTEHLVYTEDALKKVLESIDIKVKEVVHSYYAPPSYKDIKEEFFSVISPKEKVKNYAINKHIITATYEQGNLTINRDNLKDYQFYKYMDPNTCYSIIDNYISCVLSQTGNEMIELEDKWKIQKHGFDLKTSFRNTKKK